MNEENKEESGYEHIAKYDAIIYPKGHENSSYEKLGGFIIFVPAHFNIKEGDMVHVTIEKINEKWRKGNCSCCGEPIIKVDIDMKNELKRADAWLERRIYKQK